MRLSSEVFYEIAIVLNLLPQYFVSAIFCLQIQPPTIMSQAFSSSTSVPVHPDLGKQVRLISKGNESKRVWLDTRQKPTQKMMYVLVEDAVGGSLTSKRVMKTSVLMQHASEPKSRFQAMIQQKPEIEADILRLAKKIAKCKVDGSNELKNYVADTVNAALDKLKACPGTNWTELDFKSAEERKRIAEECKRISRDSQRWKQVEIDYKNMQEQLVALQQQNQSYAQELERYHKEEIEQMEDNGELLTA